MQKHLLLAALSCTPLLVQAQEADSTHKEELLPTEILAIRGGATSPFSKTTVTQKEIAPENTGQDLPYILQNLPSIVVSSDAGTGIGYTNMSVRGSDVTRINFTINGIPVNNPESQGAFLVNIPDLATSASSIEIQRGVGSSTNGAGAFGATVSISNMQQPLQAGGSVDASIGSFNTQKLSLKANTGLLKNGFQFDVRLSQIKSDGYIQRSYSNLRALQFNTTWNMSSKSRLRFNYMLGDEITGQTWNGISAEQFQKDPTYNALGLMPNGQYYDNQTDNYTQQYYQLFYDYSINPFLKFQVAGFLTRGIGYYQEYRQSEDLSDYSLPNFIAGNDTFSSTNMVRDLYLDNYFYGATYNLRYEKNKTALTFGGMISQYDGKHYGIVRWADYGVPLNHKWYNLDAFKADINNYLKVDYALSSKLSLYADVQWRIINYKMNGFRKNPEIRHDINYQFLNPKVGVNYTLKQEANNKQNLFFSYAMANREPNRNDFEAGIDNVPKPEQLHDFELGYNLQYRKLEFGANAYYMAYKNQLVLNGQINDVGAYTRINVAKSYRAGLELNAKYTPVRYLVLQANATFSQNKIKNFKEYLDNWDTWEQEEVTYKNTDIAFSPNVISAAQLSFAPLLINRKANAYNGLYLILQNKYVGAQYLDNSSQENRNLDAYNVMNFKILYSVKIKKHNQLSLGFTINNLANKSYISNGYSYAYLEGGQVQTSNGYFPQARRFYMLNIGLTF